MLKNMRDEKTANDRHSAIAVSFDVKALPLFKKGNLTHVVRRKIPASTPRYMYIYINSPVSGIIGRADILSITQMDANEIFKMSDKLEMTTEAISRYVGTRSKVGLYVLGKVSLFKKIAHTSRLQEAVTFHPPQNFYALRDDVVRAIELEGSGS